MSREGDLMYPPVPLNECVQAIARTLLAIAPSAEEEQGKAEVTDALVHLFGGQ